MRVGFLTIKTGPLASGGLQMEQGVTLFLKEHNNMLGGRPSSCTPPTPPAIRRRHAPRPRNWWSG